MSNMCTLHTLHTKLYTMYHYTLHKTVHKVPWFLNNFVLHNFVFTFNKKVNWRTVVPYFSTFNKKVKHKTVKQNCGPPKKRLTAYIWNPQICALHTKLYTMSPWFLIFLQLTKKWSEVNTNFFILRIWCRWTFTKCANITQNVILINFTKSKWLNTKMHTMHQTM